MALAPLANIGAALASANITPGGNLIPMPGPTGNYLERSTPMQPAVNPMPVGAQMPQNRLSAIPYNPYPDATILDSLRPAAGSLGDPNVQANPLVQAALVNPQLQNALSQLGGAGEPGMGDISNNPDTGQLSPAMAEALGFGTSAVFGPNPVSAAMSLIAMGVLPPGTPIGLDRNNPNPNIATNADIAAQMGLTGGLSSQGQSFDPTAFSDPVSAALGDLFGFDMSSTFGSDFGEFGEPGVGGAGDASSGGAAGPGAADGVGASGAVGPGDVGIR